MRILFVEDDLSLAVGIEYILKQEGFKVSHKMNLKDARDNIKNEEFDLVLLDVMLPDGTGYEFCKEIRVNSEIPIIFMTACDDEANIVLGLDIGGDDYVTKPVRVKELISRINAVFRRRGYLDKLNSNKNEEKLVSGDITIEPLKYKVYKRNEIIELTSIEYKLILILMNNNGNVLERGRLLEKLWDVNGDFVDANSINVYIKRLREKIEDDIKEPYYIKTIRGVGYVWEPKIE